MFFDQAQDGSVPRWREAFASALRKCGLRESLGDRLRRWRCAAVLAWGLMGVGSFAVAHAQPQPSLPRVTLSVGMYHIQAELAATPEARAKGLMYRPALAPNEGMLFVFPVAAIHCMWMKNTYIPLSVAFLDETGRIVNIAEMSPLTLESHCAAQPVPYALEMPASWFRERGIVVGMTIQGVAGLSAPR